MWRWSGPGIAGTIETGSPRIVRIHAFPDDTRMTITQTIRIVPTQSATEASSWLAIPNIGQICEIEPVRMKYDHDTTTISVAINVPGSQLGFSNGFHARPRNSWTTKRATRVPV